MSDPDDIASIARRTHIAWATSDRAALSTLLTSEYHHVDLYGQVFDRAGFLEYAAEPRSAGTLTHEDEQVTVIGDVGVLTSTLHLDAYDGGVAVRLTQVFLRAEDGWRRRWYQATKLELPG